MFRGAVLTILIMALTSCNNTGIQGSWVEPVPGMPNMEQGFTLQKGGKAVSINMATLQYLEWARKDNLLILSGNSIGNRQTIPFSDTLQIEKLTSDELIIKRSGGQSHYYSRK